MFEFIFRGLVFDFLYSFFVGLALMLVMLPIWAISKREEPGLLSYIVGVPVGMVLCAVQGIMMAAAVVVALQVDSDRWSVLWYLVGFGFSVPIALVKSLSDPRQSKFSGLGIAASNISYVLACIFPAYIPPLLGDMAVKLLL